MNNALIVKKDIPLIAFTVLLSAVLACGSNTSPTLVNPSVSSIPKKETQINKPSLTETVSYTETPRITATAAYTATSLATTDPYTWIGGDWPYGIWDYIFDNEKGARGHLKVYMGEQKSYIFEIIGAATCSLMPSGQGYLVSYPNGNVEWKDRLSMEKLELFVLRDDLTDIFKDFNWNFFQCP